MKSAIVTAAVATVASASVPHREFVQWAKEFGKTYDVEEIFERFEIFQANHAKIQEHNNAGESYTMALNQFADLNPDQFKQMYYGLNPRSNNFGAKHEAAAEYEERRGGVDWRTKGVVTPVKDQGQCGSCWAFSTTGSVEAATAIKESKSPVSLSEQQLVDCAGSSGNLGCNGGLMDDAFQWIEQNGGLCKEEAYSYTGTDGVCKKSCNPVSTVTGFKDVAGTTAALASAVDIGPVSIAIEADQSGFQFYNSGVFSGRCGKQLDHGVLAVGYGTDDGKDYWIVKNSWGASWGEEGYIRIEKGKNLCGIHESASFPKV